MNSYISTVYPIICKHFKLLAKNGFRLTDSTFQILNLLVTIVKPILLSLLLLLSVFILIYPITSFCLQENHARAGPLIRLSNTRLINEITLISNVLSSIIIEESPSHSIQIILDPNPPSFYFHHVR